jgi:hypothetical protein
MSFQRDNGSEVYLELINIGNVVNSVMGGWDLCYIQKDKDLYSVINVDFHIVLVYSAGFMAPEHAFSGTVSSHL